MTQEIHAHKVLNLLKTQPMTEQELREKVASEFGENVRFRTCKLNGFDLESLLAFFVEREKIVAQNGQWAINLENVCSH